MYECFNCGHRSVVWQADFSFEDVGHEGDGIVHCLMCDNCNAWIEYYCPIDEEATEAISLRRDND